MTRLEPFQVNFPVFLFIYYFSDFGDSYWEHYQTSMMFFFSKIGNSISYFREKAIFIPFMSLICLYSGTLLQSRFLTTSYSDVSLLWHSSTIKLLVSAIFVYFTKRKHLKIIKNTFFTLLKKLLSFSRCLNF